MFKFAIYAARIADSRREAYGDLQDIHLTEFEESFSNRSLTVYQRNFFPPVSHQTRSRKSKSSSPSRMARYGVSKDSPVGVAVGVGPIGVGHSILPPSCNTSHHHQHHIAATHPPNAQPAHNHHGMHHAVHHQQQQPPLPSPGGPHHPLALNLNQIQHHQQQQAQTQHQQLQPQFRVITSNSSK